MSHLLSVKCAECGETLDTHIDSDGAIVSDEYHRCIGKTVGYVGEVFGDRLACSGEHVFELVIE